MGFGAGLGAVIGGIEADQHLSQGIDAVNADASGFKNTVAPYDTFGKSLLPEAKTTIGEVKDKAGTAEGYDEFAARYEMSPGVKYQMDQADRAQDASAASRGGLLSGTNMRALSTINQGIASTGLNQAYGQYLAGNQQQFGQLETALGNMFQAIGVGTTATGQQAGVTTGQMSAQAGLSAAQAKNDQAKGAGMGTMFDSLPGFKMG